MRSARAASGSSSTAGTDTTPPINTDALFTDNTKEDDPHMDGFTEPDKAPKAALRGERYLQAYHGETGSEPVIGTDDPEVNDSEALVDLLTDLRHWADHHSVDFDKVLASSEMHYEGEISESDEGGDD